LPVAFARYLHGLTAHGALEEAVACLREGIAGLTRWRCYGLTTLGAYGAAVAAARDGLTTAEKTGQRRWEAEFLRLEGIALSGLNRLEEMQINRGDQGCDGGSLSRGLMRRRCRCGLTGGKGVLSPALLRGRSSDHHCASHPRCRHNADVGPRTSLMPKADPAAIWRLAGPACRSLR
jgi:hypothetical protein